MENKRYNVSYKLEKVKENKTIVRENYSCITITNFGDSKVIINNCIPVASGETWEFNELPNTIINTDFQITFERTNQTDVNFAVVTTSFYKEI